MPPDQPEERGMLAVRVIAMPADTNPMGDIFGGWLMSQVDLAGGQIAFRRAGGRVATVAVNSFQFEQPVKVGDLVSCYGEVVRVGNTSLTVRVQAFAERGGDPSKEVKVTEAELTFVAVDDSGRPRPVPKQSAVV
ncbi:MAG: acyl-CoA thioesterase [Pseudomonadota bacterium]|nr:acyl-CoA thioesterase [Pseudomonadota bacterium]